MYYICGTASTQGTGVLVPFDPHGVWCQAFQVFREIINIELVQHAVNGGVQICARALLVIYFIWFG
jgi:hypothetical protein